MSECNNNILKLKFECGPEKYSNICRILYSKEDFWSTPKILVLFGNNGKYIIMDAQPENIPKGTIYSPPCIFSALSLHLQIPGGGLDVMVMSGYWLTNNSVVDINTSQVDKSNTDKNILDEISKNISEAQIFGKADTVSIFGTNVKFENISFEPKACKCGCKTLISGVTHFIHNKNSTKYGLVGRNTTITVKTDFEAMGVGGYSDMLIEVVRRVFMSRMMSNDLRKKQGIKHAAGMILHGPPGTGKTLIARTIANMIGYDIVVQRGPEVSSKYIGESEEKVRKLFTVTKPTVIVFDEMESLFATRGEEKSEYSHSIVNTLLAVIDGINERSVDIFIVGTTNNIDRIDPAFRRPGRFECEFKVDLPTRDERKKILMIHSKNIINNNMVDNIDFDELADTTSGYSGAQLEGLVRNSIMVANQRYVVKDGNNIVFPSNAEIKVSRADFGSAMKTSFTDPGFNMNMMMYT